MFSSTQNSQPQPPQPDSNATLAQAPAVPPVLTVAVSDATSTSASSVTASTLLVLPQSFREQGGTLKRNVNGKNEVWAFFQIYDEKKFTTHAFCMLCKSDVNYGRTHSTSNLEKHMQRHHKKDYENIMCERANKCLKLREADVTSMLHLPVFSKR